MTLQIGIMGEDQFGYAYHIGKNPPRKWLLEYFRRQHADKMYIDDFKTGKSKHIGYIVAGRWITLYNVSEWATKRSD